MDVLRQADFTLGPLFATFLLGFTTIVLLFWHTSRKQSYWKKIGIPYVKPLPFFGSIFENLNKPLHVIDVDRFCKYGRIYGIYEGNQAVLSVAEPEILRNILVKDFPVFSGRRIVRKDVVSGAAVSGIPDQHRNLGNILVECSEDIQSSVKHSGKKVHWVGAFARSLRNTHVSCTKRQAGDLKNMRTGLRMYPDHINTLSETFLNDLGYILRGRLHVHYHWNSKGISCETKGSTNPKFETGDKLTEYMLTALRGEDWKRVRSVVSPTFSTGKIKRMMSIFKDCSITLVKNFRQASESGKPVDAKSLYGAFTMDTIASTAFSTKIDSHNDPNNKFVATAKQFFLRKINLRIFLFFFFPVLMKIFKTSFMAPEVAKFFTDTVLQIMDERKKTSQTRNDFLQLLMDTAKEVEDEGKLDSNEKDDIAENYGKTEGDQILKSYLSKKTLSHQELVAQCVIFFIAGYDTTASTLSFVSYLLALHPEIQERLIQEVDEALKDNNLLRFTERNHCTLTPPTHWKAVLFNHFSRLYEQIGISDQHDHCNLVENHGQKIKGEMTYEAIQRMKYLDNVIAETLRIYPPFVRLERVAEEDYKLGDTGLIVPKGMLISIPIFALHRDPKLFPNPEVFDPDRFSLDERAKQVPYSYMPFGAGPRNCIAMRFALMEIKVCLAHVLCNFRIKKCSETKVPLEYDIGIGFLQPKGISLVMETRKDSVEVL